jgi:hypothetical protein
MDLVRATARRLGITGELMSFYLGHRRWWMLPLIVVVLLTAALVILSQSSALSPFFYPLF